MTHQAEQAEQAQHHASAARASALSRRSLLKAGGALVVSIGVPVTFEMLCTVQSARALEPGFSVARRPPLLPDQLASYIAINADGTIDAYFGKVDLGQGLLTAIGQIVAEELDVRFERVRVNSGDTATTLNQGDASGSTGVFEGGRQMRFSAAEARRILLLMAAERLKTGPQGLVVADGIVTDGSSPRARRISYAELIGGRYFNVQLDWNGRTGNALFAKGLAQPKDPHSYQIVGKPLDREDVAAKIFGTAEYVADVRIPGMWHGRVIRPAVAGAVPVMIDESSLRGIPTARVVWQQGFLGVVAASEWDAIRAAERLQVRWSRVEPPFPQAQALYDHIRAAPPRMRMVDGNTGDVDRVFTATARGGSGMRVIQAEYHWPFQSHASLGPACAVAQIRDGQLTCWTGSQKPHFTREGLAGLLGIPAQRVRVIWRPGPGSYGRNDAGDAAMDAAVLAQALGRPVRVQYMRDQGTGWDPKAPASIHQARAAIDSGGNVIAYEFTSKGFSRLDVSSSESDPAATLAGQLRGGALQSADAFGVPGDSYEFPNRRYSWQTIAPLLDRASPLRTTHMRDPVGPQIHFASESFVDEMAEAAGLDPVQFRLRHLREPRDTAVIRAVVQRCGWQPRPRAASPAAHARSLAGRGMAYIRSRDTRVAVVADIEIDRASGRIWARRITVAHDCGLVVNPRSLRHVIEGNVVQGLSRTLLEEVRFNTARVTSVDWESYPILEIADAPELIDVVLLDRPELPASGAGEPATRPIAAAIGNAFFDATGVRLRRAPLSPERVKSALSTTQVL